MLLMKSKVLMIGLVTLVALAAGACAANDAPRAADAPRAPATTSHTQPNASHAQPSQAATQAPPAQQGSHDGHNHGAPGEVPAFVTDAGLLKNLSPTLSPALFTGKQREGYEAAKAIPRTLAQLPCFCYCDKGFGHKSLQTCFVDDHAAHCAVCIDEALLAYQLEKEAKLTPAQIRERIIAQYTEQ
jgi:hypothetical protein